MAKKKTLKQLLAQCRRMNAGITEGELVPPYLDAILNDQEARIAQLTIERDEALDLANEYMDYSVKLMRESVGRRQAERTSNGRYKPPPCPICRGKQKTVSSPKGVRKVKCEACNKVRTLSR